VLLAWMGVYAKLRESNIKGQKRKSMLEKKGCQQQVYPQNSTIAIVEFSMSFA
jgi:hypothetical protein